MLGDQDRTRWDRALVMRGIGWLEAAATGDVVSEYHVEAAIAAEHAIAVHAEDTRWNVIVEQYDLLFAMHPTAVVALNRAIAIGERDGPDAGLAAIDAIDGVERLAAYPFLPAARGTFELQRGHAAAARAHFERARDLARNPDERRFFDARISDAARAR